MDEKHVVWAFVVFVVLFAGEPDLLGSMIEYLGSSGGR